MVSGSQPAGAFVVDVRRSRLDAFVSCGHKWMCAGVGAGFVFIDRSLVARRPQVVGWFSTRDPFAFDNRRVDLLESHRRSELGSPPFAQIAALDAAVGFLAEIGIDRIEARVLAVNTYLIEGLDGLGIETRSPRGAHRSGQTLCGASDPAGLVAFLRDRDIHVTPKPEGIRVATHFYNDASDIERLIAALQAHRGS